MPATAENTQSRRFRFTINNYTCKTVPDKLADITEFMCWAEEEAPTTGTPHLQGYLYTRTKRTFKAVKERFMPDHPNVSLYACDANHEQNITYVKGLVEKKGFLLNPTYEAIGVEPVEAPESARLRYTMARSRARAGQEVDDPELEARFHHYYALQTQMYGPRLSHLSQPCGVVYIAPSGYGKSNSVRRDFPDVLDHPLNKWCPPNPMDWVRPWMLDDVCPKTCEHLGPFIKRWADEYTFTGEYKGGQATMRPSALIMTTQWELEELFPEELEQEAVLRRFRIVRPVHHITGAVAPPRGPRLQPTGVSPVFCVQ